MATTPEGRIKQFCRINGIQLEFYKKQVSLNKKWCTGCKKWHSRSEFANDNSRYDGLTAACVSFRNEQGRKKYVPKTRPKKGRVFVVPRDGDKKQARRRVNYFVESGLLPHPNTLPCVDCGHVHKKGERRHEYDHHKGYEGKSHELVEVVCSTCHKKRTNGRKN